MSLRISCRMCQHRRRRRRQFARKVAEVRKVFPTQPSTGLAVVACVVVRRRFGPNRKLISTICGTICWGRTTGRTSPIGLGIAAMAFRGVLARLWHSCIAHRARCRMALCMIQHRGPTWRHFLMVCFLFCFVWTKIIILDLRIRL